MKRTITGAATLALISGLFFAGCQSPNQKATAAESEVKDAKQDLKMAQQNADSANQKAKDAAAWDQFKNETTLKIAQNETRITELKLQAKKSGKAQELVYGKKIDLLEKQNQTLKTRLDGYDKGQTGWESFKREFSHDMDGLGEALKNFVIVNNK